MRNNNMIIRKSFCLGLYAVALSAGVLAAQPSFRVISYMNQLSQVAGVTEGSPGTFYSAAGPHPNAIFSITSQGTKSVLVTFSPNDSLLGLPITASNGRYYSSVVPRASQATVFSVSATPGSAQIYPAQSMQPILIQSLPDTTLLGIAVDASNIWHVAKSDLQGNVTSLYQFASGEHPAYDIALAADGNYYGVSMSTSDYSGYVYRLTPAGSITKLMAFPSNTFYFGYYFVPLLQSSDGSFYGAIPTGGMNGTGVIYKLTPGGQYTLLYTFPADNSSYPTALIEASDGNLYGATLGHPGLGNGHSQLFRITKSGQYTLLFGMTNYSADGICQCWLTQGSDGAIYGSAQGGGVYGGGLFFALDAGLAKPQPWPRQFGPHSGPVGTRVRIWGSNLLSASVQFNGVPAVAVSNSGANYVWATVPTGATTGPITVVTPGGTNTTKAVFTVQ